jgi:hypothetical protein
MFLSKEHERQIILKNRPAQHAPRNGSEGKLSAKSSGWDENPVFLEDDNEVPVKNGR